MSRVYTARVSRGDPYLVVHVPEIDQHTQAHTKDEIVPMARDLVAVYLDIPESDVEIHVEIDE
jgi:hypothetical protein